MVLPLLVLELSWSAIRIVASYPSGRTIQRGEVRLYPRIRGQVESSQFVGFTLGRERRLVVSELPFDLFVASEGYRTRLLEGVDGDRVVRLEPGIPVRLVLRGLPGELPRRTDVRVTLHAEDAPQSWSTPLQAVLDESVGEVALLAPHPGRYGITLQPLTDKGFGPFHAYWYGEGEHSFDAIEIRDSTEEQTIEWQVPRDAAASLVEHAR